MILFWLYNVLSYLGLIIVPIIMKIRIIKQKENPLRVKERYGFSSKLRPKDRLIWVHAVSVGELNSALPIINELIFNKINVLVTTSSFASINVAKNKLPHEAIHQMFPTDCPIFIKRFLKFWQPESAIFMESEIWPNTFYYTSKIAKLYIINANIPDKAYKIWTIYLKSLFIFTINCCTKIYTSSIAMETKLKTFAPKIEFLRHTKYDVINLYKISDWITEYKKILQDRTVIIFASTHPKEDDLAVEIHVSLKQKIPNLLTIIAPRHLHRLQHIKNITSHLSVAIYPENEPKNDNDIILVNTIGDLMLFYYLCDIAIVCGSFVPKIGGHNPLEPASLSKPIIIGEYIESCAQICNEMLMQNAIIICDKNNLINKIEELCLDRNKQKIMGNNANNFIKQHQGSSAKIIKLLCAR